MLLVLEALEVAGRFRWRWLLSDGASGVPLGGCVVQLDPAATNTEAFLDVYRFLRWEAAPDRRVASEAELVGQVGAFIGAHVLGESIGRAIVDRAPVTVLVRVPATAEWLAFQDRTRFGGHRLSCPIRRESEKWDRHAAHIRRSTRSSR